MRLSKTISLQVSSKLPDKTKDEIMTEALQIFAGPDVKAVQVAYEVVRVTLASPEHFWAAKSLSGKHLPVLLFHILSLITMSFFSASLSLNLFLVALADGNWMYPSSGTLSFFKLFATSGLDGGSVSPLFHFFRIGGTEARNISKVLRYAIVVVLIINVLCRALPFLPLFVIWRVESMMGLYLLCRYMSGFLLNLRLSIWLAEGARARSRVKWAEEGETSSRFF